MASEIFKCRKMTFQCHSSLICAFVTVQTIALPLLFLKKSKNLLCVVRALFSFVQRKDKPVGQVFGSGFSLNEFFDAVADVFNGVSGLSTDVESFAKFVSMSFGLLQHHSGLQSGVSSSLAKPLQMLNRSKTFHSGTWASQAMKLPS